AEDDDGRRRAEPHAHGALPRSRRRARASGLSPRARPDAARAAASGDAGVPHALDDAAAGVLRRARRRQVAAAGHRARAAALVLSAGRLAMTVRRLDDARTARVLLAPALLALAVLAAWPGLWVDRKSTRLNSSHVAISYAV